MTRASKPLRELLNAGDDACLKGTPMIPLHRDLVCKIADRLDALEDALAPFAAIADNHGTNHNDYPAETIFRCEVSAGEIVAAKNAMIGDNQ